MTTYQSYKKSYETRITGLRSNLTQAGIALPSSSTAAVLKLGGPQRLSKGLRGPPSLMLRCSFFTNSERQQEKIERCAILD
ncbi:hypothetical protein TNCV_2246771 [Trichonephila clavipes]|nr:hypothetical protein TNCV_2246771 [Trichonephila clavipes]